jgi:cellulose synthase/poly-beta-1,6-N-acetylglucosamine synthase-like glycosyltransferase
MIHILQIVFWSSLFFVFYAYVGYPIMLFIMARFKNEPVDKGSITPFVSFIITAYNEKFQIENKIGNTLEQDYPKERLEIIVASDCSTDGTDEIVRSYEPQGVKLVRATERKGKENAQYHAIDRAAGEILVFSDVATVLTKDGISNIVQNFNDKTVGCVSSVDKFIDPEGKVSGEGAYVKYEMFLRGLEGKVNSLVGLSGSFFAARKTICKEWSTNLPSDFNTLLNSVKIGLRGVLDPDSIGYYHNISDERKEYGRKVRTILRGISVFMKSLDLLNPFRYGLFAWQIFSHKLCRWMVPFAMISALISNLLIIILFPSSGLYVLLFVMQSVFYALAMLGITFRITGAISKIPAFFVLVNISILRAWFLYFRGESIVMWTPSDRRCQNDNAFD